MHRTLQVDSLQASIIQAISGVSENIRDSRTAKSIEIFITVTDGTTPDFDFTLETAIEELGQAGNFSVQKTFNITAAIGTFTIVISRDDFALGRQARVSWTRNAGDLTFDIKMGRTE